MFNLYSLPPLLSVIIGAGLACVSILKGKFKIQNILFSMVVLWWTLVPAAFLFHYIYKGDRETILAIERIIHIFYVFVPAVNLLFFHRLLEINRKAVTAGAFLLSAALCIQIITGTYFNGILNYSWGSIAARGTVSNYVGLYGFLFIVYLLTILFSKLRKETNRVKQLKIKYILVSIIVIALLQILNLPAMYGVDLYPFGNFMFIPLVIMSYGILQNKLLEIRTVLHISLMWWIVTALALSYNIVIYLFVDSYFTELSKPASFLIFPGWFFINYHYIKRIQPKIDQLFNKRKFDLKKRELATIGNILRLRTLNDLSKVYTDSIKNTLYFRRVDFWFNNTETGTLFMQNGSLKYDTRLTGLFLKTDLLQKDQIETDPFYTEVKPQLLELFDNLDCDYIIPLVQNDRVPALLTLSERLNLKLLNPDEKKFIKNITSAVLISIENSTVYQDLKNLKDNLEEMVNSRTKELSTALNEMEAAHREIAATKDQLQIERDSLKVRNRMMEDELLLAKKIQQQLIPAGTPTDKIHAIYKPMDKVGGDFFDFMKFRDPDKTGIFVSDVSGHGVPAAFITSMIKTIILQTGVDREDPAALLTHLNDNLLDYTGGNFVTAFYCIYNRRNGELLHASAGHTDPCLITGNSITLLSGRKGFPLAVRSNPELKNHNRHYTNNKVTIPPHSKIIFYTDGLTECTNSREPATMFEDVLHAEILSSCESYNAAQFAGRIYDALVQFRGSESFEDDVCIICLNT